jgi:hypothetical protein
VIDSFVAMVLRAIAAERRARRAVRARTERSRVARVVGAVVALAATAVLEAGWLPARQVAIAAALVGAVAVVSEWRRTPSDAGR